MRKSILRFSTVAIIFVGLIAFAAEAFAESWKFGVMSDTQWKIGVPDPANCPKGDTKNCDGKNPNSVAVGIINEFNKEFIRHKFVIHTGDITDKGDALALDTTATFRQALYNAGIGYYPLRGNHEGSQAAAVEFRRGIPIRFADPCSTHTNDRRSQVPPSYHQDGNQCLANKCVWNSEIVITAYPCGF